MSYWSLNHLFAAYETQFIGDRYAPTGIYKTAIQSAVIDEYGIQGDVKADRKVHGGLEKALHQYAPTSYFILQQAFPELAPQLMVGSLGENISAEGMNEDTVHIGDIIQIGAVVVQVSQPRSPCWKINDKLGNDGLAKIIDQHNLQGWYYRVLQCGTVQVGDAITLLERPNSLTLRQFLQLYAEHRPDLQHLQQLADCSGLNPKWRDKIMKRLEYLSQLNN